MFKVALCVALTSTAEGAEGKCQGDFCTADVSDAVETSLVQTGLHFITAQAEEGRRRKNKEQGRRRRKKKEEEGRKREKSTATTAPCTGQSWTAGKVPLHLPDEYWKLENCDNYPCAEDTLDWCYSDSERRNDKDLCESHYLVYPNAESVKACEWQEGGGCSNAKEEQDCPKVVAKCTGQSWTAGKFPLQLPDKYWEHDNCGDYPCPKDTIDWCYSDMERRKDKDSCEAHYLVYPNAESVRACEWQEGGGCSNAEVEQDCPTVAKCTGQAWTAGKFPIRLPDKYWEHDNCGDYPCPKDTIEWCRSDVERRKDKYLCESHYLEYPNAEKVRGCVWKETTGPGFHGGCENAELEGDC